MQPYYFWIFNLLIMSLLASCVQQHKTSTSVSSLPPKDTGSQPQQNTLSLPIVGLTPSPQPNMGSQPQQNTLSLPTVGLTPSPQPKMGKQPQQNAMGFPNAVVTSSSQPNMEGQSQNNILSFPTLEAPVGKSQPQAPPTHFSPNPKSTQTGQQKPNQFIVQPAERVQPSQQNPVQQKQPQAQSLLNDRISSAQTDIEAATLQTNPNSTLRLSLKEAFERADARNHQLLATQRNLKISAAGITIAGATPNPQIALQYGFGSMLPRMG